MDQFSRFLRGHARRERGFLDSRLLGTNSDEEEISYNVITYYVMCMEKTLSFRHMSNTTGILMQPFGSLNT